MKEPLFWALLTNRNQRHPHFHPPYPKIGQVIQSRLCHYSDAYSSYTTFVAYNYDRNRIRDFVQVGTGKLS